MAEHVYLIWQAGTSLYKIGKANNPAKRLKDLQTGHSGKLHLIAEMECQDALRKEFFLHHKYKSYRTHGEWFNIPPTVIHEVFAEFRFHVDSETPDSSIYYWVTVAETWKAAASTVTEQLKGFVARFTAAQSTLDENDALLDLQRETINDFAFRLIEGLPCEAVAEPLGQLCLELAEQRLIAAQIGITEP